MSKKGGGGRLPRHTTTTRSQTGRGKGGGVHLTSDERETLATLSEARAQLKEKKERMREEKRLKKIAMIRRQNRQKRLLITNASNLDNRKTEGPQDEQQGKEKTAPPTRKRVKKSESLKKMKREQIRENKMKPQALEQYAHEAEKKFKAIDKKKTEKQISC